jgi:hypothetical protein
MSLPRRHFSAPSPLDAVLRLLIPTSIFFGKRAFPTSVGDGTGGKCRLLGVEGPQIEERSGAESTESSRGRFVAHTKRMLRMKKSSRLWWLHGAILLSAVIGCKNCNNSCPGPGGAPVTSGPVSSYGSPTVSGGPMSYSTGGMAGGYQGGATTSTGSAFPSTTNPGYTMPNVSSSMSPGAGGVGR